MGWASDEFNDVDLGDKRLDSRLVKLCDSFSEAPESPINQACEDWQETKAAYRFFQNENVDIARILAAHQAKTATRAAEHEVVLAIQDTSYLVYTHHPKTTGLGEISMKRGKGDKKIYSRGLVMHTCLAVTDQGVPLGLFDQNIFARELRTEQERKGKSGKHIQENLPVEEKESYRWIKALNATSNLAPKCRVVTVCDRECDFYDFFKAAQQRETTVLVRASQDRNVNRTEENVGKLWNHVETQPLAGSYTLEITARGKTKTSKARTGRIAEMEVRFCSVCLNPPRRHAKHKTETLPDIAMYAVHALEKDPPEDEDATEWMLLTNQPVATFEDACEQVRRYSLRWRIEMYFKVLKSGFRVEQCRLQTADRLICYLAIMSIVAWRLFMITLVARTNPTLPSTQFLSEPECKVLVIKSSGKKGAPTGPLSTGAAVILIAKLGGYLARKSDGPPGTLVLWRGWKRLIDLTEGWCLANQQ